MRHGQVQFSRRLNDTSCTFWIHRRCRSITLSLPWTTDSLCYTRNSRTNLTPVHFPVPPTDPRSSGKWEEGGCQLGQR